MNGALIRAETQQKIENSVQRRFNPPIRDWEPCPCERSTLQEAMRLALLGKYLTQQES